MIKSVCTFNDHTCTCHIKIEYIVTFLTIPC
uniref:Uncharacterized protein n=1 Tax=Triticum urartu TaxID=4572 RepID=A0A8R7PA77_TRIUA